MNVCAQVHKRIRRINVRRQGYKSDLLLLNSDINERNNRKSCLNLVFPRLKCEIERGGGGAYIWCEGNKTVESRAKFFKEV